MTRWDDFRMRRDEIILKYFAIKKRFARAEFWMRLAQFRNVFKAQRESFVAACFHSIKAYKEKYLVIQVTNRIRVLMKKRYGKNSTPDDRIIKVARDSLTLLYPSISATNAFRLKK